MNKHAAKGFLRILRDGLSMTIKCQCHYCNGTENLIDIPQVPVICEKIGDYRPSIFFKICKTCAEIIPLEQQKSDTQAICQKIADEKNKEYREEEKEWDKP